MFNKKVKEVKEKFEFIDDIQKNKTKKQKKDIQKDM